MLYDNSTVNVNDKYHISLRSTVKLTLYPGLQFVHALRHRVWVMVASIISATDIVVVLVRVWVEPDAYFLHGLRSALRCGSHVS